jgi:hypothetical protein
MIVLLDEVGVPGWRGDSFWKSVAAGRPLRGDRFGLPPGRARLLPLEPYEQALAREADDAATP